jgi:hypothetical protein
MKLVENWKDCWKWFSVRALAAIGLLPAVWMMLPEDLRAYIPVTWLPWIAAAVAHETPREDEDINDKVCRFTDCIYLSHFVCSSGRMMKSLVQTVRLPPSLL